MKKSILADKSFDFAVRIVKVYRYLCIEKNEYVLSKQLERSGTAIGALISEGVFAESKADFVHKYGIAQKECNETIYWLRLLNATDFINQKEFESLSDDATELIKMITASILTAKRSINSKRKPPENND
ncbi:MAG: four helix bundle protein [Paludibacter sp.]|nr:four helix bundle protein [Paludibacter sp.]